MPSTNDLKSHATSTVDFYALLSLPTQFSQNELDRAWRRTALKYHPDKVGPNNQDAQEKFHLASIAYEIFSDPVSRALYDNARTAREQKRRQAELFEGKRRKMKEQLEGRERGVKRSSVEAGFDSNLSIEEESLEREIKRLAEDGKRRRKEMEAKLRQEMKRNDDGHTQTSLLVEEHSQKAPTQDDQGIPELDRTIKARFIRDSTGPALSSSQLPSLFARFGPVESAFMLKDKRTRLEGSGKKQIVGTGVIVFKSVVAAHASIEGWTRLKREDEDTRWNSFERVFWAGGKEPEWLANVKRHDIEAKTRSRSDQNSSTMSPADILHPSTGPSTPKRRDFHDILNATTPSSSPGSAVPEAALNARVRKVPSFASFSPITPKGPSSPFVGGVDSPSLEELTMMRLRNAEKRRLEAEKVETEDVKDRVVD